MKTKTSILTLTKAFFILLVSVCLFSCNNLPTRNAINEPYIINSIEEWTKTMCKYKMSNGTSYAFYDNDISVIDTIGKFAIGDSVVLSLNKL